MQLAGRSGIAVETARPGRSRCPPGSASSSPSAAKPVGDAGRAPDEVEQQQHRRDAGEESRRARRAAAPGSVGRPAISRRASAARRLGRRPERPGDVRRIGDWPRADRVTPRTLVGALRVARVVRLRPRVRRRAADRRSRRGTLKRRRRRRDRARAPRPASSTWRRSLAVRLRPRQRRPRAGLSRILTNGSPAGDAAAIAANDAPSSKRWCRQRVPDLPGSVRPASALHPLLRNLARSAPRRCSASRFVGARVSRVRTVGGADPERATSPLRGVSRGGAPRHGASPRLAPRAGTETSAPPEVVTRVLSRSAGASVLARVGGVDPRARCIRCCESRTTPPRHVAVVSAQGAPSVWRPAPARGETRILSRSAGLQDLARVGGAYPERATSVAAKSARPRRDIAVRRSAPRAGLETRARRGETRVLSRSAGLLRPDRRRPGARYVLVTRFARRAPRHVARSPILSERGSQTRTGRRSRPASAATPSLRDLRAPSRHDIGRGCGTLRAPSGSETRAPPEEEPRHLNRSAGLSVSPHGSAAPARERAGIRCEIAAAPPRHVARLRRLRPEGSETRVSKRRARYIPRCEVFARRRTATWGAPGPAPARARKPAPAYVVASYRALAPRRRSSAGSTTRVEDQLALGGQARFSPSMR